MYYVYLLVSDDNSTYVGYTCDLKRRYEEHQRGGCQTTKGKNWHVAYYEAYASQKDAMRREKALKDGRAMHHLKQRAKQSLEVFLA